MIKVYEVFFQGRGSAETIFYYPSSKAQGDVAALIHLGCLCSYSSIHDLPYFNYSRKFKLNIIVLLILFSVESLDILFYITYLSPLGGGSKFL